jgi:hypothetical protein
MFLKYMRLHWGLVLCPKTMKNLYEKPVLDASFLSYGLFGKRSI